MTSPVVTEMSAFGTAVALHYDTALVACPRVAGLCHGVVETFRRDAVGVWRHDRTLEAPDAAPGDGFGTHLALDSNRVVISVKAAQVYFFHLEN